MKALLDLNADECRYPFGEGHGYLFCAEPTVSIMKGDREVRSSYCKFHQLVCTRVRDAEKKTA